MRRCDRGNAFEETAIGNRDPTGAVPGAAVGDGAVGEAAGGAVEAPHCVVDARKAADCGPFDSHMDSLRPRKMHVDGYIN